MRRSERERRQHRVDHIDAGQDRHQMTHAGGPAHVVAVEQHWKLPFRPVFDTLDDPVAIERCHDSRRVFERQPVRADLDQLLGIFHPLLERVNRAHGVVDLYVRFTTKFFDRPRCHFNVSEIVGRFEYAKNVHAISDGSFHEFANDRIRVRPISQNMLPPQKHLQFSLWHYGFNPPQSVPRIFLYVSHAHVERRSAPDFYGVKATIVDGSAQRQQVISGDPRYELTLLTIARREVGDLDSPTTDGLGEELVHVRGQLIQNCFTHGNGSYLSGSSPC